MFAATRLSKQNRALFAARLHPALTEFHVVYLDPEARTVDRQKTSSTKCNSHCSQIYTLSLRDPPPTRDSRAQPSRAVRIGSTTASRIFNKISEIDTINPISRPSTESISSATECNVNPATHISANLSRSSSIKVNSFLCCLLPSFLIYLSSENHAANVS